jgi:hypothetical protein
MTQQYAGQQFVETVTAATDLTGHQFKPLLVTGTLPLSAGIAEALGILQTKTKSGYAGTVCVFGVTKLRFGLAANPGNKFSFNNSAFAVPGLGVGFTSASGQITNQASLTRPYGTVITSVASGGLGTVMFRGPAPYTF